MVKQTHSAPAGQEVGGKISAKSLGFDKPTLQLMTLNDRENDIPMFRVLGRVIGLQAYKSKFEAKGDEDARDEEGFGLVGSWRITILSGERAGEVTTQDGTMFIPGAMHDMAVAAFQNGDVVNMALDVFVRFSEKAGPGYTFVNRTLIEPDHSALDELDKMIGNTPLPALPAPK
jgi:hypothetical protein